ncbi:MAG: hypothetical protein HQK65_17555 [Desulfamplus sp.]|nr:hypothetical protein [Desulfamplus sp.]
MNLSLVEDIQFWLVLFFVIGIDTQILNNFLLHFAIDSLVFYSRLKNVLSIYDLIVPSEIKEAWTGGYKITIDMDSPIDPLSGYDVDAFKISKETALALNKDQLVTFTGIIDSVLTILGTSVTVSLEDAELL